MHIHNGTTITLLKALPGKGRYLVEIGGKKTMGRYKGGVFYEGARNHQHREPQIVDKTKR